MNKEKGENSMKKFIICALVALMVIPFAMLASSDVPVPAEPTLTSSKVIYVADTAVPSGVTADTNEGAGDTSDHVLKIAVPATKTTLFGTTLKDGGKVVFVGKGYMGNADLTVPASTSPIMFTGKDETTDFTSRDSLGNPYYMNASGKNDGQFGMFMITTGKKVTFEGDVIFKDVVILSRLGSADASDPSKIPTIVVKKSAVIDSSVTFADRRPNQLFCRFGIVQKFQIRQPFYCRFGILRRFALLCQTPLQFPFGNTGRGYNPYGTVFS